jgi:hypothetical protein
MKRTMTITRQHAETEIPELAGAICHDLIGVGSSVEEGISILFLKAGDVWYRVYIDVGVLFWNPGEPDPDAELAGDEQSLDLLERMGATSLRIEGVRMQSGELRLEFVGPRSLVLVEQEESGRLRVDVR